MNETMQIRCGWVAGGYRAAVQGGVHDTRIVTVD
jgi:hypothetical protein